jgi:hypothetical protein
LAFLAWHVPSLAGGLIAGQPSLSTGKVAATAVGGGLAAMRGGSAVKNPVNQVGMALSMVACSMLFAVGLITVSMKSSIEPYVVQVDGATGRVISVDPARVKYDPSLAEKK